MPIVSVDLAYKRFRDIGVSVLQEEHDGAISCEFIRRCEGELTPQSLATYLDSLCLSRGSYILLLDGPQGWKAPDSELQHSRRCERELNTPAKTGNVRCVKPANYEPFVSFSIGVYDALTELGWERLHAAGLPLNETKRTLVESFPLSAWRALGIKPLPAKQKSRPIDLVSRLEALQRMFDLYLSDSPTHDELQALVSGIAGLAIERNDWRACKTAGITPQLINGLWCEGFIVNALPPIRAA